MTYASEYITLASPRSFLRQAKAAKKRLAQHRRARADYRALLDMDDRTFKDIGLTRSDVMACLSNPHGHP